MPKSNGSALNVIGIGASAGGLEAVSQLLQHLPDKLPAALVILQHLSPHHKSMMAEILSREAKRDVKELSKTTQLKAGGIYIVPPNFNAVYENGKVVLTTARPEISPKPSVNQFFSSIADAFKENAVGVVLSGTGSDGTSGLRAIQASGGLTLVQEPATAKYDGMPRSAILADAADFVLPATEIGQRLVEFTELSRTTDAAESDRLHTLMRLVKESYGHDFEGYKQGTLLRRVKRRMVATDCDSIMAYVDYLGSHQEEISMLARDLLISVTAFFRDLNAFKKFAAALKSYYESHEDLREWRIWVAGCATGEEAYSVAILVAELQEELERDTRIQIFATDLDEQALQVARRGRYSEGALAEVQQHLREKYFDYDGEDYEVNKQLRDMVVFAKHNLVSDPPFMRVDFITCRNVLIYFDTELQKRVLKRFHFALNPSGYLFLGRSESISAAEDLFQSVERTERLFMKASANVDRSFNSVESALTRKQKAKENPARDVLQSLTEGLDWVIVELTSKHRIRRSWGQVSQFFNVVAGDNNALATDMVAQQFRSELISLLHRFQRQPQLLEGRPHSVDDEHWQVIVLPMNSAGQTVPAVVFRPLHMAVRTKPTSDSAEDDNVWLQEELVATKEHLQAMLEELSASNEEMQSLNEETQASNEELQATNEELEAANEELQASNEELISLNQELNTRTHELARLNEEYTHVYDALEFPILVFSNDARLQRFNAAAQRQFALRQNMSQRELAQLKFPATVRDVVLQLFSEAQESGDVQQQWCRHRDEVMQVTVAPGLNQAHEVETLLLTFIDVSDIAAAHEQLRASQQQLDQIISHTTLSLAMKDLTGHYSLVNPQFSEVFAVTNEAAQEKTDFELFPEEFASSIWEHDLRALRDKQAVTAEHTLVQDNGGRRIFRMVHQALVDPKGKPYALLTEAEDITLRKNAEQQLQIAARVYEQAGEAIVVLNGQGVIQTVNSAFLRLTELTEEQALNFPFWNFLTTDQERGRDPKTIQQTLQKDGLWQGETLLSSKKVEQLSIWLTINQIKSHDANDAAYVAVFADISNLKESQRKVEYLATHDSLTGLPNRTLFHDRLEHALEVARRRRTEVGVLFIDLDNFKQLNDTLGHDAGDELLIQAAERLKSVAREMDTVARLGGDEFTIIIVDSTMAALERVAREVLAVLDKPFIIQRQRHYVGGSIGIAIYPDDGTTIAELLKAADTAMYRAKENGRGRYELFKEELQSQMLKQTRLENDLRQALQNKELTIAFQPKYTLTDPPRVIGAEALVRWHHEEHGDISPADFIPAAELTNLIVEVDSYVARELVQQMAKWRERGLGFPIMALNASPKSFQHESYVDLILHLLEQYKLDSLMLQLELTERTLVTQQNTELGNIERLRNAGIQLSIDDFGTGYSSLSYLKRLPLAELKIDKTFVDGVVTEVNDEAISRAILAMAKALKIKTVAEGVESEAQVRWLTQEGCDYAQGYYFSKPLSLPAFEELLKAEKEADDGNNNQ
ncbi:EAL domain-containing protein [Pseudidiomarina homiensis]|uniref:PAS domain S-box protein n=1 Tax=Pseudidiomarina homiensis TaxID=364198 RepID=A0A432XXV3_9GAMM|nr:EAL domain-containing protein [Pseudidiomarina homiensis]RUO53546.1 PAS domain S-box protein [Pseudidiomarina homiensis]